MNLKHLVFFIFLLKSAAHAQDTNPVDYIGIEHGLSNNAVTSIYQDHNGFMWFGTYDGLNRYDGYSFRIFRNVIGDSASLGDNHVSTLEGDAAHNIWIGCEKGLYVFDPVTSRFSRPWYRPWGRPSLQPISGNVPVVCSIDNGYHLLAGTANEGLLLFEKGSQNGVQIPLQGIADKGRYSVTSIAYDASRKSAWIMVRNLGLCQYDIRTGTLRIINRSFKESDCLKVDNEGHLWMGTDEGLFQFNSNSNVFSKNVLPYKYRVIQVSQDQKGTLWIASDGGGVWSMTLQTLRPEPYLFKGGASLINSNAVYSIYEDREGRKWIGTLRGGINLIQPRSSSFRHISYEVPGRSNRVDNFILSFCEDGKNNVWVGTDGAGLRYWDRTKNSFTQYSHDGSDLHSISSNFVTSICRDSYGDIWASTWFGGINRLSKDARSFEHFTCFNPVTRAVENNAWLVYEDRQKRLWASTTNNGTLYQFNRKTSRFELFDEHIENIQCLAEDSENNFWGGNYTSLIRIDRLLKHHLSYNLGYTVRCIHEDRQKNLWIGTDGGGLLLFNRSNGHFRRFSMAEGLPSNTILRLLEDEKGNLWLSTYNGLCKFNVATRTCRNFSQSDGLQSNQFSFNASLALTTGEFLFGGIKGFNIFHPDSIYDKKETAPVFLTGLRINNTPVEAGDPYVTRRQLEKIDQVTVSFDQAVVSLDFVALEYGGADKIKYAYLLEGWDKGWNYVNTIRTANYSRLQEGTYAFKIKVTNSDGVWSRESVLLKLTVLPPWYRTWWSYLLYALVLFSAVYLYIIYNKRQERLKYEVKLAHLENEKEKELTEKKISFFTHISHEFRTPLTLIINPLKELVSARANERERKELHMVYRNARRLLSLVDQLLLFRKVDSIDQGLRVEKFDIVEACHEVFLSFGHHAASRQIDFVFDRPNHEIAVYGDKEKIEIILFNLLSNAFKYTNPGGKIGLIITDGPKQLQITVQDTGSGIDAQAGSRLFHSFYQAKNTDKASQTGFGIGLYVSQKLANAHNGMITYDSCPGEGTAFHLLLTKGKEHFAPGSVVEGAAETGATILHELVEEPVGETAFAENGPVPVNRSEVIDRLTSELPLLLIVDDNDEIRAYLRSVFAGSFVVLEAVDGTEGYELVLKETPDMVISDVMMTKMGGIELCQKIKNNPSVAHIPVILLTASTSDEIKLKGIEGGAEDYIMKPFDKEIVMARVRNILKGRNRLQQYFFNAVTLKPSTAVAGEHKEFIERCIAIVEDHLDDPDFTIQTFCRAIGMSHPGLYKKVKAVSGLTVNVFIRYIRLRKAAELLITTDKTIAEVTYITGFNDTRYFRQQFFELFKMKPSDYIKKYRKVLGSKAING